MQGRVGIDIADYVLSEIATPRQTGKYTLCKGKGLGGRWSRRWIERGLLQ